MLLAAGLCRISAFAQSSWEGLGGGANFTVQTLASDTANDILYAGGYFVDSGDTIAAVGQWDGDEWQPVGNGVLEGASVSSLIVYNGELIMGGRFSEVDETPVKNVARWTGTGWETMGDGLDYTGATTVSTMRIYHNALFAGGQFDSSGEVAVKNIAKWNGTYWEAVAGGFNGPVKILEVFDGNLYAGGTFTSAGEDSARNVAYFDATSWHHMDEGIDYTGATTVSTMKVYHDELYVGGTFDHAGEISVSNIARWDGDDWSDVDGGTKHATGTVIDAMTIQDEELIVAGLFDSLGTVVANNIGKWDGYRWTDLTGTNNRIMAAEVHKGKLYIGGLFDVAGGRPVAGIAKMETAKTVKIKQPQNTNYYLFPNPAEQRFTIIPKKGLNSGYSVFLFNQLGKQVASISNVSGETEFDRKGLDAGMYFYKIISDDVSVIQEGKIIFN
jgi:hypothetical protein